MRCETVFKWTNLMKGRGKKELEQFKSLSLRIKEVTSKSDTITEKKGKQNISWQIMYINQEHLPPKFTPVIDFTDEPGIQCEAPVVENTVAFKKRHKLL